MSDALDASCYFRPFDGNSKRNRYRRYAAARTSYGMSRSTFREWLRNSAPDSYTAYPHHINYDVPFLKFLGLKWQRK